MCSESIITEFTQKPCQLHVEHFSFFRSFNRIYHVFKLAKRIELDRQEVHKFAQFNQICRVSTFEQVCQLSYITNRSRVPITNRMSYIYFFQQNRSYVPKILQASDNIIFHSYCLQKNALNIQNATSNVYGVTEKLRVTSASAGAQQSRDHKCYRTGEIQKKKL